MSHPWRHLPCSCHTFVWLKWLFLIFHLYLSGEAATSRLSSPLLQNLNFPSLLQPFVLLSLCTVAPWISVFWCIVQSRRVKPLFSLINVCLANTLIIASRANRIDNYTLYTEALSHSLCLSSIASHCFFHSFPSLLSFSIPLKPVVCHIYFCEHSGVFFPTCNWH